MRALDLFAAGTCLVVVQSFGCATARDADPPVADLSPEAGVSVGGETSGASAIGGSSVTVSTPDATSTSGGNRGVAGDNAGGGNGGTSSGGVGAGAGAATGAAGGAAGASRGGAAGSPDEVGGAGTGGASLGLGPWTFDAGLEGWAVRDHSATISTLPAVAAGVVTFTSVPFSAAGQYIDFALSFSSSVDLTGRVLHAEAQRVSGGFVGVQLYAYGGAWVGSAFTSLNSAKFIDVALPITAQSGFDPQQVTRIGLKFDTGANASNTFSATTLELDSVTIQ